MEASVDLWNFHDSDGRLNDLHRRLFDPTISRERDVSEALERGAKAMQAKRRELINQPLERIWPELMRAAILSLREPTEDMEQAYYRACDINGACLWQTAFRTMIDAAAETLEPADGWSLT